MRQCQLMVLPFIVLIAILHDVASVQWKNTGGLKQKHKKQPYSDANASHLSLVLRHV